jgi:hypothetical protein
VVPASLSGRRAGGPGGPCGGPLRPIGRRDGVEVRLMDEAMPLRLVRVEIGKVGEVITAAAPPAASLGARQGIGSSRGESKPAHSANPQLVPLSQPIVRDKFGGLRARSQGSPCPAARSWPTVKHDRRAEDALACPGRSARSRAAGQSPRHRDQELVDQIIAEPAVKAPPVRSKPPAPRKARKARSG